MKRFKRIIAMFCMVALVTGGNFGISAQAAKKPVSLSETKITLKAGKSKTLRVKKSGKVKIKKKTFRSDNKKVATVTKKGKITAKKAGKATIKVTVKYKKGKKVKTCTLKCQVTVTKKDKTPKTVTSKPSQKSVVSPSLTPTASPSPTPEVGADLTISSERELNEFAQKVNNGNTYSGKLIQLTQDIQYDGITVNNYTPIAHSAPRGFQGTFDGCGHTISGIDVTDTTDDYERVALFGYIGRNGVVKNLFVSASSFTDSVSNGGCIAYGNDGIINNCHNRGVSAHAGIVNRNAGTIMNCSSTGDITSKKSEVGGIVRYNAENGQILNCCNMGNIYSTDEYCADVGGIAGSNSGNVQNCYNTGAISCKSASDKRTHIGGITGANTNTAIVANSYCSEESAETNFGTMSGVEKNCKAFSSSDMQIETFVDLLNGNRGRNTEWLNWGIMTDGSILYPIPGIDTFQKPVASPSPTTNGGSTSSSPAPTDDDGISDSPKEAGLYDADRKLVKS